MAACPVRTEVSDWRGKRIFGDFRRTTKKKTEKATTGTSSSHHRENDLVRFRLLRFAMQELNARTLQTREHSAVNVMG